MYMPLLSSSLGERERERAREREEGRGGGGGGVLLLFQSFPHFLSPQCTVGPKPKQVQ